MKTILCFGDSNTYGLKPDGTGRYDFPVRYPGRLQALLGGGYRIIEEGCPGRTTVFEDRIHPYKKGLDYITPCLQSHRPLDFVIVMLGTNDCKSAFRASCKEIASGLAKIIDRIKSETDAGILIVSPIHLGPNLGRKGFDPEFDERSVELSRGLAEAYCKLAQRTCSAFLDASTVARVSPADEEHLDEAGHAGLAQAVAGIIKNRESSEA